MTVPVFDGPLDRVPVQGVYQDWRKSEGPVIVLVLDPEEAEALADLLPAGDAGARELYELVIAARRYALDQIER